MFYRFYDTFDIFFDEKNYFAATLENEAATLETRLAIRSEPGLSCCTRLVKAWGTPVSANEPGGKRYMTSTNFLALRAN